MKNNLKFIGYAIPVLPDKLYFGNTDEEKVEKRKIVPTIQ